MTDSKPTTIDEYIATLAEDKVQIVQKVRETIKRALPEASEMMSYNMPTFDLNGRHIVYFGAWNDHLGLYPFYGMDGELEELFRPYNKVHSSIHLPYNDPRLYEIIEKFALFREKQELENPSHY